MFYNSYLAGGLLISVCSPDVHFCEQNELIWEKNRAKSSHMADLHFRLYVSIYEIKEIMHGRWEIRNLSSRVQLDLAEVATPLVADLTEHSKINFISPCAHVFSISLVNRWKAGKKLLAEASNISQISLQSRRNNAHKNFNKPVSHILPGKIPRALGSIQNLPLYIPNSR